MTELSFAGEPLAMSAEKTANGVMLITTTRGQSMEMIFPQHIDVQAAFWVVENELQRQFGDPEACMTGVTVMPEARKEAQRLVDAEFEVAA